MYKYKYNILQNKPFQIKSVCLFVRILEIDLSRIVYSQDNFRKRKIFRRSKEEFRMFC